MMRNSLALASLLVVLSLSSQAQEISEPFSRLITAETLRCEFGKGTASTWTGGKVEIQTTEWGKAGDLVFDSIDLDERKARLIGNIGGSDVFVLPTPMGISFIEATSAGNLNVTTVFPSYVPSESRRLIAVISRHVNMGDRLGGPAPQQYQGSCAILP